MEDLRTQQIEALEVAVPYCAKISNALNNLWKSLTVTDSLIRMNI